MLDEITEEQELLRRQPDITAVTGHDVPVRVDGHRTEAQQASRRLPTPRPPQHRPDASDQLLGTEGLGDVVVAAELQTDDAVGLVGLGRQHDDGHARCPRPRRGSTGRRPGRCDPEA